VPRGIAVLFGLWTISGIMTVTVCIATFNSERVISRTLDSVLAQTYSDFRCVVSDDASTDRTVDICRDYSRIDGRLALYRHAHRVGWVKNVNRSLGYAADTRYMMILPHDDTIAPTYLEKLVGALEISPGAAVAFSDMEVVPVNGGSVKVLAYDSLCDVPRLQDRASILLRGTGSWGVVYRGVFRTEVYRYTGGLREHMRGEFLADYHWILKLALHGQFLRIPETLYTKYKTVGSITTTWDGRNLLTRASAYASCFQAVAASKLHGMATLQICCRIAYLIAVRLLWKRLYNYLYTRTRNMVGDKVWNVTRRVKQLLVRNLAKMTSLRQE